jgi:putative membrane protein
MSKRRQVFGMGLALVLCLGLAIGAMAQQEAAGKADAAFLKTAAKRQQSEIQLSQLAAERSESEQVKQFAQRMVQDHTKAHQEISKLAETLGITLSASSDEGSHKETGNLSSLSGAAFDRAYLKREMADHKKNLSQFAAKSKTLKNPHVREWASATLPVLKEHLSLVKGLASKVAKTKEKKTRAQG